MPKALETDWELIKVLWLQGFTPVQIFNKTGVKPASVKSRAYRFGWNDLKCKSEVILKSEAKQSLVMEAAKDLAAESKHIRNLVSQEIKDQIQTLRNEPVRKAKDIAGKDGRAATTLTIVKAASEVFGWGADNNKSIVNVAILGQLPDDPETLRNQSQVVDVETVEQQLPSD